MVLAIDTSNIFFITFSMFKKDLLEKNGNDYVIKEEDLGLFYHMFIKKVMPYLTSYKDCVFCWEGKGSTYWRKEIWPPYKENRAEAKADPNYAWVSPLIQNCKEFISYFHVKNLEVENCEGDDCIYQTCKYYAEKNEPVKIISTDKDLSQIINFYPELVTQYNPVKQSEVSVNENILLEKCIVGDTSDNIKAFKGIGPKTFEKMLSDKILWNKKVDQTILDTVMKIVDLRQYPTEYQNNIKIELEKDFNNFDKDSVEKFFLENGLKSCYSNWSEWCGEIEMMLNDNKDDAIDEIMDILNA